MQKRSRVTRKKKPQRKNNHANILRIIGGDWRSRKLTFVDAIGLRPTPDRIRETLFNWLQGRVHGSRCLDLFAGSGALGLEALSRGAGELIFVEKNKAVATQLKRNLDALKSDALVYQDDALDFLQNQSQAFDIIFLDPPYRQGLLEKSLALINKQKLLQEHSLIYLEHESEITFDWQDFDLEMLKSSNSGQVSSFLLQSLREFVN